MQTAKAGGISIGVRIGLPLPVFYSAPVTYSVPAPCYSYCPAPPPVVVYRAPVRYAPAPVVNYRDSYGGEHHHYRRGRW